MLSARALSGLAEDRLADRPPAGRLAVARALAQARRAGDQVLIYNAGRLVVIGTSADAAIPAATLTSALHGRTVVDTRVDDRLRVTVPVLGDSGNAVVGAVVLSRSSARTGGSGSASCGPGWPRSGWRSWALRRSRRSRWPGGSAAR